jgi:hypothetical protein
MLIFEYCQEGTIEVLSCSLIIGFAITVLFFPGAGTAKAVDNQLFTLDFYISGNLYPRQLLFSETNHPTALPTEKVRMIAGAAMLCRRVSAKTPGPIYALDLVNQAAFCKSVEGTVDSNPVNRLALLQ